MLFFLVYVSVATRLPTLTDLDEILEVSRVNNLRRGITGLLLAKDNTFMQLIEGEESVVHAVYDRIAEDPRHRELIVIWSGYEATRQFKDWSMAFRDLKAPELASRPGFSHFLDTDLDADTFGSRPSLTRDLLTMFTSA